MPITLDPMSVFCAPDGVPNSPPVATRIQLLPFGELSWENFERLCHRMTAFDGDIEYCARYGRQGDAQEGIDIFARQADGRYHCLQAKRHRNFNVAKLCDAVDLFVAGSWSARTVRFTIVVQASLRSPEIQEEIERQAAALKDLGIIFSSLDGEDLTDRLRSKPVLIDDFFGRAWVAALLGDDVADSLGARLDGGSFARARSQLAKIYTAQFQFVDPGSFGSIGDENGRTALTLLERFLKPDMLVREVERSPERIDGLMVERGRNANNEATSPLAPTFDGPRSNESADNSRVRRLPLIEWLGDGQRLVVLGDAGCGKSTLLRVVALDLLQGQTHFPDLATRWGQHIPIYVPFARWSSQVARDGSPVGIKEVVRRSLEQLVTSSIVDLLDRAFDDQRVLLLVDGLDEWSNEQAARATLSTLVTTVEAHGVPVIVSGRPRGLSRIGALPANWKRGTVAPLSSIQQTAIAGRWFGRYATSVSGVTGLSETKLRTDRFMADMGRDANLSALATVPLLLIGLVTLALRGQILPRTKGDIYDQLVRVLLEVHPINRATASGDTESRFRHATDPDQRRAAIAKLAFVVREQAGGAGIAIDAARDVLRSYFASPQGLDLVETGATAAANEILSVNAETQGLLVEKAPGEVGFVHASFEEFLGAEHIGCWPFSDIEDFVRAHAGEGRWRNVITNFLGGIQRRDEFDRLIALIEEPDSDELGRFNRLALLGDIAFGVTMRAPATARRLALATIHRVEAEDWLPARREALASVLKGLPDPTFKADIELRLSRWLPARHSYERRSLVETFSTWRPTVQLQHILYQALHDEDQGVQRTAAAVYAKAFAPSAEASQRLLDGLATTRNLVVATAMLESLALGWPDVPAVSQVFEDAWHSHGEELRLIAILWRAATGTATDEARDFVLHHQNFWSGISSEYRELAVAMLMKYWPGDETLIQSALRHRSYNSKSPWEHDAAVAYLMESPIDHADVRAWILAELENEYPFHVLNDSRLWSQIGRFATVDLKIRSAANAYWCKPKSQIIGMYKMPAYVAQVADPAVADMLIGILEDKKRGFDRYWALTSLLTGWKRDDPIVKPAIDALADVADEELICFVSLLPNLISDKAVARQRLIRMGMRADVRRDLLATGLEACGCDGADQVAVAEILRFPDELRGAFDPSASLFRAFSSHIDVRALALERVHETEGSLAAVSRAYADDPDFVALLFDAAVPLPVNLRAQVIEVAATGAVGTALEKILSRATLENDSELRTRMTIAYYQTLPLEAHDDARQTLLAKALTVGVDYESGRTAALAGLVTIGALDELAKLEYGGKPIDLETGSFMYSNASIERLICEKFADFENTFGDDLHSRFKSHGVGTRLAEILSTAPSASPAARAAFLALAERGEIPCTPRALRALASERPRSELLLQRCWDALNASDLHNDRPTLDAEVGLILREHFSGEERVHRQLLERFNSSPSTVTAIVLAIFSPDAKELKLPSNFKEIGHKLGDWAVAMHVASIRTDCITFCQLLEAMVTRPWYTRFDAQKITNIAIEERLQRDSELVAMLSSKIGRDVDPSICCSFVRYLAAAGKLSPVARGKVLDLLHVLATEQRLPIAIYDAVADQWRTARAALLDAVSTELELA